MTRIERCENQMQLINNVSKIYDFYLYLKNKQQNNKENLAFNKKLNEKNKANDWYEGFGECINLIIENYEHAFKEELL